MATHYEVLGVPGDADDAAIKRAYVDAARRFHPDALAHASDQERATAEARMQEVNAAWSVLRNPVRRREYDRRLRGEPEPVWQQRAPAAPRTRPVSADEVRRMASGGHAGPPTHGGSALRWWPAVVLGGVLLVIFVFTAYAANTSDEPTPVSSTLASPFEPGSCVLLVSSAGRVTPIPADCTQTGASEVVTVTDVGRPCPGGVVPFDLSATEQRLCLQER